MGNNKIIKKLTMDQLLHIEEHAEDDANTIYIVFISLDTCINTG